MSYNRRGFLKKITKIGAATVALPYFIKPSALGLGNTVAPSNRITLGFIGIGDHGYGVNYLNFVRKCNDHTHVSKICDADFLRVKEIQKISNEQLKLQIEDKDCIHDFRQIIDDPTIDAVVISTPDHWHVPMSIMALKKGKHVFCEKPTRSLDEGKMLVDAVKASGKVYQTGLEDRSIPAYRQLIELCQNGYIGDLERAFVSVPSGNRAPIEIKEQPIPEGLDWEIWQGPAKSAPYQPERCKYNFRWVRDYSVGVIADWGTHTFDTGCVALLGPDKNEYASKIELLEEPKFLTGLFNTAYAFSIKYTFSKGRTVFLDTGETYTRIEGSKGWIECPGYPSKANASDPKIMDAFLKATDVRYRTEPQNEQRNFVDSIKSGRPVYMPAVAQDSLCWNMHAGAIAMDLNESLEFKKGKFTNEKANAMTSVTYRDPWKF